MLGSMSVSSSSQGASNQGRPPPQLNKELPQRVSPSTHPRPSQSQHPGGRYDQNHRVPHTAPAPRQGNSASYNHPSTAPSNSGRLYSPPPQHYGFGPPPSQPAQNRPPPSSSYPSRSPQPPQQPPGSRVNAGMPASNDPHDLFPLFRAANASNSGALSPAELGSALVNGDYTAFDRDTVTMMIRMFDRDNNGRVGFDEFVALWRFLAAWRELFDRFDEDRSGRISFDEFNKALVSFGYRLSQSFIELLFTTFDRKGRGKVAPIPGQKQGMSFDLFVQACLTLKRMTDVFKRYDEDRDGYITLGFEEFLTGMWISCLLTTFHSHLFSFLTDSISHGQKSCSFRNIMDEKAIDIETTPTLYHDQCHVAL